MTASIPKPSRSRNHATRPGIIERPQGAHKAPKRDEASRASGLWLRRCWIRYITGSGSERVALSPTRA